MREEEGQFHRSGDVKHETEVFSRVLLEDSKRKKYQQIPRDKRYVLHWGQRKLLLSEIEFLTLYGEQGDLMVYAGAAPGTHIPFLSELFPKHRFELWDPSPFAIQPSSKIKIMNDFFTMEVCKDYVERKEDILFVSDIRTANAALQQLEESNKYIEKDNHLQRDWVLALNPKKAMLKFRFPYCPGKADYFDGEIRLPCWGFVRPFPFTKSNLIFE